MTDYLLDTHVIIWLLLQKELVSKKVIDAIAIPSNRFYISTVSFWEITIKYSSGKLDLGKYAPIDILNFYKEYGFLVIDLVSKDAITYHQLETTHHRDPFDRMLIWQAIQNKMVLVSNDANMPFYKQDGLKLLW